MPRRRDAARAEQGEADAARGREARQAAGGFSTEEPVCLHAGEKLAPSVENNRRGGGRTKLDLADEEMWWVVQ